MRVVLFANNWLGWHVAARLGAADELAGLVVHPPERQKFGQELLAAADLPADRVLDGAQSKAPGFAKQVEALGGDLGLSVLFDYLLPGDVLRVFPRGVLNLHPSLLPYNRGQYPNVWSIVERTPSGVTLHYLDEGVDTGDLVAQREVPVAPTDTGATLYAKLERAGLALFDEVWPAVRAGRAPRRPQPPGGTVHRTRDVDAIDRIDLDRTYRAGELLDVLRARTFPPYRGAWFEDGGRRVYVRIQLLDEQDLERS